jgi:hypothetical protein
MRIVPSGSDSCFKEKMHLPIALLNSWRWIVASRDIDDVRLAGKRKHIADIKLI